MRLFIIDVFLRISKLLYNILLRNFFSRFDVTSIWKNSLHLKIIRFILIIIILNCERQHILSIYLSYKPKTEYWYCFARPAADMLDYLATCFCNIILQCPMCLLQILSIYAHYFYIYIKSKRFVHISVQTNWQLTFAILCEINWNTTHTMLQPRRNEVVKDQDICGCYLPSKSLETKIFWSNWNRLETTTIPK